MIEAIIFDFDGVILESADIKTRAFAILFGKDYPDKVSEIVDYHISNMGISRYVKFRHIYDKILGLPLSDDQETKLGEDFTSIVMDEVLKAPYVPGAFEFIEKNHMAYPLFIASGTPQKELEYIVEKRRLKDYFTEIHGTPGSKTEIIGDLLNRYELRPDRVIFVGDAESDWLAAQNTGVCFVARIHQDGNELNQSEYRVGDLREFAEVFDTIS
ncbi:MAG: HAD family hydrolase [Syntrophomonadaceae bacterium]|nr:HAD family hydrolase [Syntrophomonadaceae bacterium]